MPAQSYTVEIQGYWRVVNQERIPSRPGIYCVYASIYRPDEKKVVLKKLIYIGISENVRQSLLSGGRQEEWEKYLIGDEVLCFSFGSVEADALERCGAAMIHAHMPPANGEQSCHFPFDLTTVSLFGKTKLLQHAFTLHRI